MKHIAAAWEANAQIDPLFATLTDAKKRSSWGIEDFFASGEIEIGRVFAFMDKLGLKPNLSGTFLDFGCGVGRNTRALMKRFRSGVGVDVSPTMISLARQYAEKDAKRAEYVLSQETDLSPIPTGSIDFLYSHIVLQHMPNRMQQQYIADFMRIVAPDGIAAFQIPTGSTFRSPTDALKMRAPNWLKTIYDIASRRPLKIRMEMHPLAHDAVETICRNGGGTGILSAYTNSTERDCNGRIEFMDQDQATDRILSNACESCYLSEFFFVLKRRKPNGRFDAGAVSRA